MAVPQSPEKQSRLIPFEAMAGVIALTAIVSVARILKPVNQIGFGPNWEHMSIARSLLSSGSFANPFGVPTGPTAVCAPFHPALLAAILWIFGDNPSATIPMLLAEVLIQIACMVVLMRVSVKAFSSWIPGAIGVAAFLLTTEPVPQFENGMAQLAAEWFIFSLLLPVSDVKAGIVAGLSWLVSPALSFFSVATAYFQRNRKAAIVVGGVALAVSAPWIIRNSLVFRAPVFLRDNFGLELRLSNNDLAGPRQADTRERYGVYHPNDNPAVAAQITNRGEAAYFNELFSDAIQWMRENPRRATSLNLRRFALWWAANWMWGLVNLLGWLGVWMKRHSAFGKAAAAALFIFPIPYYFIQFETRYAFPVYWISALMAGYACWQGGIIIRKQRSSEAGL